MAGLIVKMSLEDSGTIKNKTQDAKELNKELGKSARLADQALRKPAAARFVAAESQEYGRGRGSAGATGAAGRDFANEAQGLGGLVRLYATYAANVFAVGAAFTALSNAMNTTNMVEGLNQLGAASGVALGTIAKQFTEASGGAISLRESMEATTKAISSGLSTKQFLELGKVAKGASQALGVNMSDAVSRLSRGITKLEPELLDELGIFTKVGKATEDYAKSVGKSVTALTDFEYRQAFANAVLEEGAQKFGAINIPTNPYDELLATLKDTAQSILEIVNTAFVPIIKALSSSPTALTAVIAGLGALVVKQALPAIGQYRAGLKLAADDAKQFADSRAASAKQALDAARSASAEQVKIEKDRIAELRVAQVDEAERNLRAISRKGISKGVRGILAKSDIQSISSDDLKVLDDLGKKQTNVAGTYRQLADAIRQAKKANDDYVLSEKQLLALQAAAPKLLSAAGITATQAERARRKSESRSIISQSSEDTATLGTLDAFRNLGKSVKEADIGVLRGTFTRVAGAASILTTAVTGIASALSGYLFAIGLVVTAGKFLIDTLSNNKKEQAALTESIEISTAAAKVAEDTFKLYGNAINFASISAKSTAFINVAENIGAASLKLKEFEEKANFISRGAEYFTPNNMRTQTEDTFTAMVSAGIKNIADPKLQKEAQEALQKLFGTSNLTAESLKESFKSLDNTKFATLMLKAQAALSASADSAQKLVAGVEGVKNGFKTVDDSFTALTNTLINNDPVSKFGVALINQSIEIREALKDTTLGAATLIEIANDAGKVRMFPAETQGDILQAAANFTKLTADIQKYKTDAVTASNQIATAVKTLSSATITSETRQVFVSLKIRAEGELARATTGINSANAALVDITKNLNNNLTSSIVAGFSLIEAPLAAAISKAGIEYNKGILSRLPKTEGTVSAQAKLERAAIDVQIKQLTATQQLVNNIAILNNNLEQDRVNKLLVGETRGGKRNQLLSQLNTLENQERALKSKDLSKDISSGVVTLDKQTTEILQRDIGLRTQLAGLAGQKGVITVNEEFNKIEARFKTLGDSLDTTVQAINGAKQAYMETDEFLALSKDKQLEVVSGFDKTIQLNTAQKNRLQLEQEQQFGLTAQRLGTTSEVRGLGAAAADKAGRGLAQFDFQAAQTAQTAELKTTREISTEQYKIQAESATKAAQLDAERFKSAAQATEATIAYNQAQLQQRLELGSISQVEYDAQSRTLDLDKAQLERKNDLFAVEQKRTEELAKWTQLYLQSGSALTPALIQQRDQVIALADIETTRANKKFEDTQRQLNLQGELSAREVAYGDIFKQTFEGMADAMVEFATTGKASFKDLINNMLADLLRYELKQQQLALFNSMGGGKGILNTIINAGISAFGGAPAASSTYSLTGASNFTGSGLGLKVAKGGSFNQMGVMEFARGGAFTNQVVNTPTRFNFAQGAGLMGEAGPEAIMPLKRDAAGNLGVRGGSGGGNVEVVVNNYGKEQATTVESVDSRGNRKIEVIVGEMVASEVSRNGSPVNNSLRNTFNSRPNIIRR